MSVPSSQRAPAIATNTGASRLASAAATRHAAILRALALTAALLCLGVVVLGAYVRLSNAGLGCPDWPGCYGHVTPLGAAAEAVSATGSATAPAAFAATRPLEIGKAWREMVHRYAAGTLASLLVLIAALGFLWRRERVASPRYLASLVAIVVVQAVLGMLTVTRQLTPVIVTLHLLFGLTTLSLLWWMVLTLWQQRAPADPSHRSSTPSAPEGVPEGMPDGKPEGAPLSAARTLALLGLLVLGLQIALGGWTSSNYAAIACPDFPTCQASWWPSADFRSAFVLWHGLHIDYEGGILAGPARIAIHLAHRLGATAATLGLLAAALFCLRHSLAPSARRAATVVLLLLAVQLSIGISMVLRGFPLWLATAHNAGAALLLLATLTLNRQLRPAMPLAL
jgi:cytochrome c oxidase assembly protein subunit 15